MLGNAYFCSEIPDCVDLVPKTCVKSGKFSQNLSVEEGRHVDVRQLPGEPRHKPGNGC